MTPLLHRIPPIDILAFSPHPDDAEIGCAGSLLLSADRGFKTAIADLSNGEGSSRGNSESRAVEKQTAADRLGLSTRFCAGLPDTKIGLEPGHMQRVIAIIRETKPRIVLAPYWTDRHPDHENAGKLVQSACFYSGVASIGEGRPYRPEAVYYYMIHSPFDPVFVVDISSVWERKQEVLSAYASQFSARTPEAPRTALSASEFSANIEARAVYFGAMAGIKYGEPFFTPGPLAATALPGLDTRRKPDSPLLYRSCKI